MEQAFSAPTEADQDRLYQVVSDLGTYPSWLELVHQADSQDQSQDQAETAWVITLRARVGPLARSKRLRMVRTVHDGRLVRFERQELDGRRHSTWTLSAQVSALHDEPWRSQVELDLRYDGSLWTGLLDGLLRAAASDATDRLQVYLATSS